MAYTDPSVHDLYRRVGALEASAEAHGKSIEALRTGLSRVRSSIADLDSQLKVQTQSIQAVHDKLVFVEKLEDFLMKAETILTFLTKGAKYAGYVAKGLAVAAVVYGAYISGGVEAAAKAVAFALGGA